MNRIIAAGGAWSLFLVLGGVCLAADQKRPGTQPAPSQPQPKASQAAAQAAAARSAAAARLPTLQPAISSSSGTSNYFYRGYYPYGGYGYYPYSLYGTSPYVLGYDPYSGQAYLYPGGYSPYAYRYPYFTNPYLGFGYPDAVFANPGQLFGLGPIQQLMGGNQGFQQPNAAPFANANPNPVPNGNNNANAGFGNGNNAGRNAVAGNVPSPPAPRKQAAAGTKATELAWKFVAFGDARFGDLKYNEALDRYRRAAKECPTLGDAWIREGFAQAAMGNYDQAAKDMRRGLDEKPDWADANFRLDDIYGDNAADKKARVDGIVRATESDPNNGDLALVAAIHLYCDGKQDQAAPFFRRAAQIQGSDANIKAFLPKSGE
jgi:tetratricopeptide (TPR) repeat protein